MPSRYFTGSRCDSNQLEPSSALDFASFVQRHLHPTFRLKITREQYWAPTFNQKALKTSGLPYATSAAFSAPIRRHENITCCNLLYIDVDNNDEARPYVESPHILSELLEPFNFVAYHSISSQTHAPRIRILVDAEGIPAGLHKAAINTLAAKLSITPNTESLIAHQPMIFPITFEGEDDIHPIFQQAFDRRPFQPSDLGTFSDAPTSVVREEPPAPGEPDVEDLAFLRAPLPEFSIDELKAALSYISADCKYEEWWPMFCAVKHQFGHSDHEEEAIAALDAWSTGGSTYPGSDGIRKKWHDFSIHPTKRYPTTIRTLIKRAHERGWLGATVVNDREAANTEEWLMACNSLTTLETEGAQRIASLPLNNHIQESRLINTLIKRARDEFRVTIAVKAVNDQVKRLRRKMSQPAKEDSGPPWAMALCYIQDMNIFWDFVKNQPYTPQVVDNSFGRELITEDADKPSIKPSELLLHKLKIPVVFTRTYDPSQPQERYVEEDGHLCANTYNFRSVPQSTDHEIEMVEEIFFEHLTHVIKEPEYRRIYMDALAYNVQYPGCKIRWATVLQGAQGCGKGFFADALRTAIGYPNINIVSLDAVKSNYNDWAVNYQVVVIEEIKVAGVNRHEVMNKLKPLITNDVIPVTQKFKDSGKRRNHANYMILTNPKDSLVINDIERRYFVVESRIQTEEQVEALDQNGYFERLFSLIKKYPGTLRYLFESWPISKDFNPNGRAPKTTYFHNLVESSANEETAAVRNVLVESEDPLVRSDLVSVSNLRQHLELEGVHLSPYRINKVLEAEQYVKVDQRISLDGKKHTFYRKNGMLNGSTNIQEVIGERLKTPETILP
jgi:hypothetical protein